MGKGLAGKTIALAASRKIDEMRTLIEKQGGVCRSYPLQGTVFLAVEDIASEWRAIINSAPDWFMFTTGIGTDALIKAAGEIGLKEELLGLLRRTPIALRGYKTLAVLKKHGVTPEVVDEDGTTAGLIAALKKKEIDFNGKHIVVQLHGITLPRLTDYLELQGAKVTTILPYQHIAPEAKFVEQLYQALHSDELDAVCFTTAIQVRALFDYVKQTGDYSRTLALLESRVVAVAVGKVTTEALKEEGVKRMVAPEKERMGAMIIELAKYYKDPALL